ncbi:nuclear transport factor 2 family protein [Kordia sp. YSTF-M3]|uniref:Nuclear transport factor 2 family protein n=1 Tax=Kordia aestuariivivens TaxID=2759037 RepID=A0ABR7Q418_9FLAO|nr:nuclear transport factor 2 family protein [Kordia aestuariivivens]MBC8753290.1 nuclear transport factor 2 family protein [Kordia aestuariivivens]
MKQKIEIIHAYINAYNAFDISGMLKDLHADIVFENYASETLTLATQGIEEFEAQAKKAALLFESRMQRIVDISKNEKEVVVAINYQGIVAVDLSEEIKKGAEITLNGKSVFSFKDQKISKIIDIS